MTEIKGETSTRLKERRLLRIIVPGFPKFNIYTQAARITTSVGPLYVATNAAKIDCWDAEVIDENNLHGRFYPRTKEGKLDHDKLQEESPADVVGFYGSITSSIPRLFEIAQLYSAKDVITIAGGRHVENLPEEALANGIDYVFNKEAEISIKEFLMNIDDVEKRNSVRGISYLQSSVVVKNPDMPAVDKLDNLPLPDYSLMRFAKIKLYPVAGTRGCGSNCEFCVVKGKPRSCSPHRLLREIQMLVEKYNAKSFFEVSDHFASNMPQAIEFLNKLAEYQKKIRRQLHLTIQTRLTDARSPEFLEALKRARIETVCIGFESPVEENLLSMNKGYRASDMLKWTKLFKRQGVRVHGMFIFAYPPKKPFALSLRKNTAEFWKFIKKSRIDTLQLLLAIPLPGTALRERLRLKRQLFSQKDIGWEYYDGHFPVYKTLQNISPEETQDALLKIMKRFYGVSHFFRLVKNIILDFPLIVFPSVFTLVSGKSRIIRKAFSYWRSRYFLNNYLCFGGFLIIKNWYKAFRKGGYPKKLETAKINLNG